jgi:hypothetical protein
MWEVVQIVADGPTETLGEYDTEEQALAAAKEAVDFSVALYAVRRDGADVWTNETGDFERVGGQTQP